MDFFKDLFEMLSEMDPGMLTFVIVVFAPGFIIAAALVYFIIRSIVRSATAPNRQRKKNREKEREERKWDDFYSALDKCTVYDVSPLPANAELIKEAISSRTTSTRRSLGEQERFICCKRLAQLGHPDPAKLAACYVNHFSITDKDKEAALKYTGLMADQGYPLWKLEYAKMLLEFGEGTDCKIRAIDLYNELSQTDEDPYLPMLKDEKAGPEAAWRLGNIFLHESDSETMVRAGQRQIFIAAMHGQPDAVSYMRALHKAAQANSSAVKAALFESLSLLAEKASKEELCDAYLDFAVQGFDFSYRILSTTYRSMAEDNETTKRKLFLCHRLGAELGNAYCLCQAGVAKYVGIGTKKDSEQAKQWLKQSAELNNADAQYLLGVVLCTRSTIQDAIYWLERAANNGNLDAAELLQKSYAEGSSGFSADKDKAQHWKSVAEELRKKDA